MFWVDIAEVTLQVEDASGVSCGVVQSWGDTPEMDYVCAAKAGMPGCTLLGWALGTGAPWDERY